MSEGAVALLSGADEAVEPLKQAIRGVLIEHTVVGNAVADIILSVLNTIENIDSVHDEINVSANLDTVREAMKKVFSATAYITLAVSEDAGEVVSEMLQEAFSNAVYSGLGGMYDLILRMKTGMIPPNQFAPDNLDPWTKALLDSMNGIHFHFTMLYNIANKIGALENELHEDPLVQDILESNKWVAIPNAMILSQYAELKKTMLFRTLESVASTLEALFQRLQDAMLEYKSAEILYNQGQIDSAQFDAVKLKVQAEIDAVNQELQAIKEDLQNAMSTVEEPPAGVQGLLENLNIAYTNAVADIVNYMIDYHNVLVNTREKGRPLNYKYIVEVNGVQFEITGLTG